MACDLSTELTLFSTQHTTLLQCRADGERYFVISFLLRHIMGKDKKKKGKGAEKTAEKTEKKAKLKAKKELAAKGEDDIESLVKAIEAEERKRQEVKEVKVEAPSHRSNFSMTSHPDNPEIVFFGGEFYNGKTTRMFNDLLVYNIKVTKPSQL